MFESIKASLNGSNNKPSAMRINTYLIVLTLLGTFVAQNIAAIVRGTGYVDFTFNSAIVLGIAITGKVAQSFGEGKKE